MNLKEEFYKKLPTDKVKINWNKKPIRMDLFLSFLTIPVERSHGHLGDCNGWTKLFNTSCGLEIGGGMVNGIEYLDNLQFGKNPHNPYNNHVSPFYMFDVLNDEGRAFFVDYYKDDIDALLEKQKNKVNRLRNELAEAEQLQDDMSTEIFYLRNMNQPTPKSE